MAAALNERLKLAISLDQYACRLCGSPAVKCKVGPHEVMVDADAGK